MTFYEAAIEVLKKTGRPLHYKKITELAIAQNLLSHVGKTPEVTMEARLLQEAEKDRDATIVKVRPGVFALAEGVEPNELRETLRLSVPAVELRPEPPRRRAEGEENGASTEAAPAPAEERRAENGDAAPGGRRRGRRRRRGRGGNSDAWPTVTEGSNENLEGGEGADTDDEEDAPADAPLEQLGAASGAEILRLLPLPSLPDEAAAAELPRPVEPRDRERTERNERSAERGERGERAERERGERAERGDRAERSDRGDRGEWTERADRGERGDRERADRGDRGERERTNDRDSRERSPDRAGPELPRPVDRERQDARQSRPGVVAAAANALRASDGPLTAREIAQKLSGQMKVSPIALEQSLTSENRRRVDGGQRPVFSRRADAWGLVERDLAKTLAREIDVLEQARDRVVNAALDAIGEAIERLGPDELEALVMATLGGLGYEAKLLERGEDAVLIEAVQNNGLVPLRLTVLIRRDNRPIQATEVAALRGRLARFNATHGLLIAPRRGLIRDGARTEAESNAGGPVVLIDPRALAPLAHRAGVGSSSYSLAIPLPDGSGPYRARER